MKTAVLQNNFAGGVFEPRLKGRTDIEQYFKALEQGKNVLTIPLGGIKRRPGLKYLDTLSANLVETSDIPTMPNGGTATNINDYDYSTSTVTTTDIDTTDPYVVAKYDLGSSTAIYYIDIVGIALDLDLSSDEFYIQYSDDDAIWTNLYQLPLVDVFSRRYRTSGATARYFRLVKIGGTDLPLAHVGLAGLFIYTEGAVGTARLVDFGVSDDDNFLVCLTDRGMAIYQNGVLHTEFPSRFSEVMLSTVDAARTDYVMLFVQEDSPPQRLAYDTAQDLFTLDDVVFASIPTYDFDDTLSPTPTQAVYSVGFTGLDNGQLFRLRLEGFETEEIVFGGATAIATADGIKRALEALPVVGAGGVTVANSPMAITFSDSTTDNFEIFTGYVTTGDAADKVTITNTTPGVARKEDIWSDDRGYPRSICFYQNRLWFGGTKSKPQSLFASRTNSFLDFDPDIGLDTDPIFVTLDSKRRNSISALVPSRRLLIFTEGSEFASNGTVITPSEFAVDSQTSYGSGSVRPVDVEGNVIFIDKTSSTMRGFLYDFGEDGYSSNNISLLSSHLIKSPVDMAYSVGAANEDSIYVVTVNNDGTASIYNTLRSQSISNFTEMDTDGNIVAVEGIGREIFFAIARDIDGTERLFLEQFDYTTFTDANITISIVGPTTTVTGLDHLDGVECRVKIDDYTSDNATPVGGSITLPSSVENVSVEVGINYQCLMQMMPLAPQLNINGVMHKKKIAYQHYMVYETAGLKVDGLILPIKGFGSGDNSPFSDPVPLFTGNIRNVEGQEGWSDTLAPVITADDPLPFTILAIETVLEVS